MDFGRPDGVTPVRTGTPAKEYARAVGIVHRARASIRTLSDRARFHNAAALIVALFRRNPAVDP
jgi:hypothetical protein